MLPDIFSSQSYVDYVGTNYIKFKAGFDISDPSTPAFAVSQLQTFFNSGNVTTGVYDSAATPFNLTFDNINNQFLVSQGVFKNNNVSYTIPQQNFKYAPLFNLSYANNQYFIATIYVNINTLQSATVVSLTISQPVSPGDTSIYVREIATLATLQAPFKVQIGNQIYSIGTVDLLAGKLILDSSSPIITASAAVNNTIFVISEPSLGCIYTQPFSDVSSSVYLANHINAVMIPTKSYRLYDILMVNPNAPSVVTTNGTQQIKTNFVNFQTVTSTGATGSNIVSALSGFNFQVQQAERVLNIQSLLSSFQGATQSINNKSTVSDFWLNTIMLQPEISSLGVDLGRFKKFDFTDEFLAANYEYNTGNLYELLYAFDPLNYSYVNVLSSSGQVTNLAVELLPNYGPNSSPTPSTITYGVTSVANTNYPSGETPAAYNVNNFNSSDTNVGFNITFDPVDASRFLYNNFYRKSVINNLSVDLLLNQPYEVVGETIFGEKLPAQPTADNQNFTGPFTGSAFLNANGSVSKFALEFIPRLSSGSVANKVFVGGVEAYLSATGSYTGSATLSATLVKPNPDLNTYTILGTGSPMPLNKISNTVENFSFKFYQSFTGSLNLTTGSTYYTIFSLNNPDTFSYAFLIDATSASGSTLAQQYTGSWANVNNLAYRFKTLGYVDDLQNNSITINPVFPPAAYTFRGVRQIRNRLTRPRNIYAYVPYFNIDALGNNIATSLSNDLIVRIVGFNSQTGQTYDSGNIVISQGTSSGNKILLTTTRITVDQILLVDIQPGTNVNLDSNGAIIWGAYDYLLLIGDN